MFVNPDTLQPLPGASGVDVVAQARPMPSTLPPGATPVSNLYRFSGTAKGSDGVVKIAPGKPALVNLRSSKAVEAWVVLHRWVDGAWQQVPTFQVGTDVYAAGIGEFGDYALFKLASGDDVTVEASRPKAVPEGYKVATAAPSGAAGSPGSGGDGGENGDGGGENGAGGTSDAAPPGLIDTNQGVSNNRLWLGLGLAVLILGGGLLLARAAARRQAGSDGEEPDQPDQP
jgi:hypothetical protein